MHLSHIEIIRNGDECQAERHIELGSIDNDNDKLLFEYRPSLGMNSVCFDSFYNSTLLTS